MASTQQGLTVRLIQGEMQSCEVAFASTNSRGESGVLNQIVARALGYSSISKAGLEIMKEGAWRVHTSGAIAPIIMVITNNDTEKSEKLLRSNLEKAFKMFSKELTNKNIWLPLMGTGGGMKFVDSLVITLNALRRFSRQLRENDTTVVNLSVPNNISSNEWGQLNAILADRINKGFFGKRGARRKIDTIKKTPTNTKPRYWALGFGSGEWYKDLDKYINGNYWQAFHYTDDDNSRTANNARELFNQIEVGDFGLIKGYGGRHDVNIHYVGIITQIDQTTRRIDFERQDVPLYKGSAPRGRGAGNWYNTILEVKREKDIRFLFFGEGDPPQPPSEDNPPAENEPPPNNNDESTGGHGLSPSAVEFQTIDEIPALLGAEKLARDVSSLIQGLQRKDKGNIVGIFGNWGRGKTFLVHKIYEELEKITYASKIEFFKQEEGSKIPQEDRDLTEEEFDEKYADKIERLSYTNYFSSSDVKEFIPVKFHPWKYQDTTKSWAYLYEAFTKKFYETDEKANYFKKKLRVWELRLQLAEERIDPIFSAFAWISMGFLLGLAINLLTDIFIHQENFFDVWDYKVGIVTTLFALPTVKFLSSLYQITRKEAVNIFRKYYSRKSFEHVLGIQAEIEKELKYLLKSWIPISGSKKVILFVDDIDRCSEERIISVIDALRVMLEDEVISSRVIALTAIDARVLKRAIQWKYHQLLETDHSLKSCDDCVEIEAKKSKSEELVSEYMDKLFIAGIKLGALTDDDRTTLLEGYRESSNKAIEATKSVNNVVGVIEDGEDIPVNNDEFEIPEVEEDQIEEIPDTLYHKENVVSNDIADLLKEFLDQTKTESTQFDYDLDEYRNLAVSIGFGHTNMTDVPWIAFLKEGNAVQEGVYPAFLYYKDYNRLILAYGVSETRKSKTTWNDTDKLQSIADWFEAEFEESPPKYGSSYVYKVYEVGPEFTLEGVKEDVDQLIDIYNQLLESDVLIPEEWDTLNEKIELYHVATPRQIRIFYFRYLLGRNMLLDMISGNSRQDKLDALLVLIELLYQFSYSKATVQEFNDFIRLSEEKAKTRFSENKILAMLAIKKKIEIQNNDKLVRQVLSIVEMIKSY